MFFHLTISTFPTVITFVVSSIAAVVSIPSIASFVPVSRTPSISFPQQAIQIV